MNVSSLSAASFSAIAAIATGNIRSSLAASAHSDMSQSTAQSAVSSTVIEFSATAIDLLRRRRVSDATVAQFKDVLARATATNAQANPKAFLGSLSASDMEALRQAHCLADTINVATLSDEGAANLLVQPGSEQDVNNDGLTTTGAGNAFTFPPANAPESVRAAWASATSGMSFADIPTEMIFAVGLANIGREPGDPNWRNPYASPNYDYQGAVANIMSSLKYEYASHLIPEEQYRQEMAFYGRLAQAMG